MTPDAIARILSDFAARWWRNEVEEPSTVEVCAMEEAAAILASGMSASGQDPQGLEAKPASPVAESETPNPDRHTPESKQ